MEPITESYNNLPVYYIDERGILMKKVYTGVRVYDYFIGHVSGVKLTCSGEPMLCTFK